MENVVAVAARTLDEGSGPVSVFRVAEYLGLLTFWKSEL